VYVCSSLLGFSVAGCARPKLFSALPGGRIPGKLRGITRELINLNQ